MKFHALKWFLFFGLFLFSITSAFSQSTVDSLLNELNKTTVDTTRINLLLQLSKKIEKDNADSSIVLCMEALAQSSQINSPDKRAACFKRLAETYVQKPFFEDSEIYFSKEYVRTVEKLNAPLKLADAYYTLGVSFGHIPQHDTTINYFEKAITFSEGAGDTAFAMMVRNEMAETYRFSGRMTVCNDIYNAMLKYYRSKNDSTGIGKAYRGIAIVHDMSGVYDSAAFYFRRTAELFKGMNKEDKYASSLQNLGVAYTHQKNYALAEKTFSEAVIFSRKSKFELVTYQAYMNLARVYIATGKAKQAIACADSVVRYTMRANTHKMKAIATGILAEAYAVAGDYKNAYSQMVIGKEIGDSIVKADNQKSLSETETRFRTKEKQGQIELLSKENLIQQANASRQKLIRNVVIGSVIILLAFFALMFNRYQLRKKLESRQSLLNERNRIARDLHDDVGATLSSISIFSAAANQKLKNKKEDEAGSLLERISIDSQEMVSVISDFVWTLNPANDRFGKVIDRMQSFASSVLSAKDMQMDFKVGTDLNNITLKPEVRKNLFLIFKEAINNAAKYSGGTKVTVSMKMDDNNMMMKVKDDGKGFPVPVPMEEGFSYKHTMGGNGIKNMYERAEEIGGAMSIISDESGTWVAVSVVV